jgi:O-acetyl-ADP-ribose deacetylase (regulator of RNase III)
LTVVHIDGGAYLVKINQTELTLIRASVLEQPVDVIVNAANIGMRGGGALDGAIHRAAGPEMVRDLEIAAPHGAKTAEVVVSGAHNLPQKWVFHVTGPVWKEAKALECDELLAKSYRGCLEEAQKRGLESIAFPSLSTGVFSFPLERAAPIAVGTVVEFLTQKGETSLRRVIFAMFGGTEFHYFDRAFQKYADRHS